MDGGAGARHQLPHDLAISSDVRTITVEGLAYALWFLEAPALPDRKWRWLTLDERTRAPEFESKAKLLLAPAREVHAPSGPPRHTESSRSLAPGGRGHLLYFQ